MAAVSLTSTAATGISLPDSKRMTELKLTSATVPANHALDRYLLTHVPTVVTLQKTRSAIVKDHIEAAISRIELTSRDHYEDISLVSTYWASDDTGAKDDSELFLQTATQLQSSETQVQTLLHVLQDEVQDEEDLFGLSQLIISRARSMSMTRRLFVLHYAGHAFGLSTSDNLTITSRISEGEINGAHLNFTFIRDALKNLAAMSEGLDVLLVLDCCFAAIAGRGLPPMGERMELMAATSAGGISNAREDGATFTQYWCRAFNTLLEAGDPFNCDKIMSIINSNPELVQYPATFVLREGWGVPITFRALPISTSKPTGHTVVTAFHVVEDPDSPSMESLIEYLNSARIKMTILAVLPVSSTLLLVIVPEHLQELLALPRVSLSLGI